MIKTGPKALAVMHHFERRRLVAYLCSASHWTIGWGMTYYPDGRRVKQGDRITPEEADAGFAHLLARDFEPAVRKAIGDAPTTAAQFGAMVALAYNIGVAAFATSTVVRRHRAGDPIGAADAFLRFDKERDKRGKLVVSNGLVRRRNAERALYLGDFRAVEKFTQGEVKA